MCQCGLRLSAFAVKYNFKFPNLQTSKLLSERQIEILRSENELLQLQLDDVNMMIQVREEELELLRKRAGEAAAMQSQLDSNLLEFEQMQNSIGFSQQKNEGASRRLEEMEEELYASIKDQLKSADKVKDFESLEANLLDTTHELQEAASAYKQLRDARSKLAATQSDLEIANMEITSLKEEIAELKALNEMLRKK
jgi:chromosome segregation ATPase